MGRMGLLENYCIMGQVVLSMFKAPNVNIKNVNMGQEYDFELNQPWLLYIDIEYTGQPWIILQLVWYLTILDVLFVTLPLKSHRCFPHSLILKDIY